MTVRWTVRAVDRVLRRARGGPLAVDEVISILAAILFVAIRPPVPQTQSPGFTTRSERIIDNHLKIWYKYTIRQEVNCKTKFQFAKVNAW